MKLAKLFAIVMATAITAASFTACNARDDDNAVASSQPPLASAPDVVPDVDPDLASGLEEGADRIESGLERGVSELEEGLDIRDDESVFDESERDELLYDESRAGSLDMDSEITNESVASTMSTDFAQIGTLSNVKDTGFPGGPVDARNRPSGPVAYQQKYSKYGAYFIVPDSDKIYLTFDEGYENGYTSRILDTLKEKNVKAVFFITYPYAKSEPALVKRMVEEGHTLGNHSTKHLIFPDMPLEEAAKDIQNLHDYVLVTYGYEMTLFRPPEGAFSEQTLALVQSLGYNTMLWSFAYKDYDVANQPLAIEATDRIVSKAHPGEICLLHAVSRTNSEILGDVIDAIRAKGFIFADYFYFQ